MPNSERSVDLVSRVRHLEQQHHDLKRRIARLDRRNYLTTREQMEVQFLKKEKLATKDALQAMRREMSAE